MGQTINTGSSTIEGDVNVSQGLPTNSITVKQISASALNYVVVPAAKKYIIISASCKYNTAEANVAICDASNNAYVNLCRSIASNDSQHWSGNYILVEGEKIRYTRDALFTYYEVDA